MKRLINLLLISFILLSLTAVSGANAAGTTFSVSGKVVDRLGNPIPNADVTLINVNYKVIQTEKTDDNGCYDFINVVTDTDTCTVRVSYTDTDGTKYETPSYYIRWYPTKGMQFIPEKETVIPRYPPPIYGYIYGAIQTDASTSGTFIDGIVYLVSLDNEVKYYQFAAETVGKGSYQFYAPQGSYMLYAQHWENGVVYESSHKQVTIRPNTDVTEVLETRIILPLYTPASDPDPSVMPEHYNNRVNGTVVTKDGKPWPGATVTLLQKADNGTGYLPVRGSDSKPLTTTTDVNGKYELYGASPTTDDGKSVQSKKDIKVRVEYANEYGVSQAVWSEPKPLYYPDMIMGNGLESQARNVTMPVVLPLGAGTPQQPTVSVSEMPAAGPTSSIAIMPLLAALAIGLLCVVGLYFALNRKG